MASRLDKQFNRRKQRVRRSLSRVAYGRARLSVERSHQHIYAQVIDDEKQHTIASASSQDKGLGLSKTGSIEAAKAIGKAIAERALAQGVKKVIFDRGAFLYHGRIKALAQAAREHGLEF